MQSHPTLHLDIAGLTHPGRVRRKNEDAFVAARLDTGAAWERGKPAQWDTGESPVLLAVSDGMGGAPAGEIASALTLRTLTDALHAYASTQGDLPSKLREVVVETNKRVHAAGERPGRYGMGATLTAALVIGTRAFIAHVGDSRAFLLRAGELTQITQDQSLVQQMVDQGLMTAEEAEQSPRRNVILQVIGQDEELNVPIYLVDLEAGDRLLLSTDGLWSALDLTTIAYLASPPAPVDIAAARLVSLANEFGGPDNTTVIVAQIR